MSEDEQKGLRLGHACACIGSVVAGYLLVEVVYYVTGPW
jgi:hypothetical protein